MRMYVKMCHRVHVLHKHVHLSAGAVFVPFHIYMVSNKLNFIEGLGKEESRLFGNHFIVFADRRYLVLIEVVFSCCQLCGSLLLPFLWKLLGLFLLGGHPLALLLVEGMTGI